MKAPACRLILLFVFLLVTTAAAVRAGDAQTNLADYLERLSKVDERDARALHDLAEWARQQGLEEQAAELYRRVLSVDPDHDAAYEQLSRWADNRRLPEEPEVVAKLKEEFGEGFEVYTGMHFILVYNTPRPWALARSGLLEKTHDYFFQSMRRAELKPLPLDCRLVCVLFEKHEDFIAYAKRVDNIDLTWSSGYYSGRSNRIAFFNDEDSPQFQEVRREMTALEKQIAELDRQIDEATRRKNLAVAIELRRQKSEVRKRLRWYENRHSAVAGLANAAKTTHEAVHQLAFNTGLQSRTAMYPFWLTEGLATNFEAPNGAEGFGPFHDNPSRRMTLKDARDEGKLTPLSELVSMAGPRGEDPEQIANQYAQVWGLFQFLFRKRHDAMQKYLQSLAKAPPGDRDEAALLKEFEDAFGPTAEVDAMWQRQLKQLR